MNKKSNRFSPEVRVRAVRMVLEHRGEYPSLWACIESIAPKIGCLPQTLNDWLSRGFFDYLRGLQGKVCFVHHQFQFARTRAHVIQALNGSRVTPEFICPKSHLEALTLLGEFQQMIDTFPYSSGLTAREAQAMGLKVKVFTGELFCERHSLSLGAENTQLR